MSTPAGVAVAVGVLMASFLVWLWFCDPAGSEDEVADWLQMQGLPHLRGYSPFRRPSIVVPHSARSLEPFSLSLSLSAELSSLEEVARLDLDSLPEVLLSSSSLLALREGVQLLELRLWLREGEVEGLLPQLEEAGHSSTHSLLALTPLDVKKVSQCHLLTSS